MYLTQTLFFFLPHEQKSAVLFSSLPAEGLGEWTHGDLWYRATSTPHGHQRMKIESLFDLKCTLAWKLGWKKTTYFNLEFFLLVQQRQRRTKLLNESGKLMRGCFLPGHLFISLYKSCGHMTRVTGVGPSRVTFVLSQYGRTEQDNCFSTSCVVENTY